MRRIAIIEDDNEVAGLARLELEHGLGTTFTLEHHERLRPARSALRRRPAELLLLDIHLPDGDGLRFLAELQSRAGTKRMPVVMLTADEPSRAMKRSFKEGAADYVRKPWAHGELGERAAHALESAGDSRLVWGPFVVDRALHLVSTDGKDVTLPPVEFDFLAELAEKKGDVVKLATLLELWRQKPGEYWGKLDRKSLDVHVHTLRRKLGAHGRLVDNVRAVGYRLLSES